MRRSPRVLPILPLACATVILLTVIAPPAAHANTSTTDAPPSRSQPDLGPARQELQEVMRDPLFSRWKIRQERSSHIRLDAMTWRDAWQDRLQPLRDGWRRLMEWLLGRSRPTGASPTANAGSLWDLATLLKIAGWVLVALTLLLLGWLLWSRRKHRQASATGKPITKQTLDDAMAHGDALVADSDAWTAHAVTLAQAKDMRLAYRAMYLALLSGLHDAGRIRYRAQRTNWTYVTGFQGPSPQRDAFAELTSQFDDIWYGLQEPTHDRFDAMRLRIDQLLRRPA